MTFVSTLGQNQDQASKLRALQLQLGTLQTQIATGKKTQSFKGLDTDVAVSKRARADFQKLDSYVQNIDRANIRIKQQMQGIAAIQKQANFVLDAIVNQTEKGEVELDSIRRLAENSFDFIVDTLNLKDGDAYIFSGSDTTQQPIIDTGSVDAFFGDLNLQWSSGLLTVNPPNTDIAEEYISRYRNIPDTTMGLSGSLVNAKQVYVRADDTVEINYTVLANDQSFKDIIAAVTAMKNIANLDSAPGADDHEQKDNFFKVFNDVANLISGAVDTLDLQSFRLGTAVAQLDEVKQRHIYEKNVLQSTISDVEDIDLNEAAVQIQSLNTQLQASYQVTALVSRLSLSNFL